MRRSCETNGVIRKACGIPVGKPEGNGQPGRQRRIWADNNKSILRKDRIDWDGLD
jgi:hypothetical protein